MTPETIAADCRALDDRIIETTRKLRDAEEARDEERMERLTAALDTLTAAREAIRTAVFLAHRARARATMLAATTPHNNRGTNP